MKKVLLSLLLLLTQSLTAAFAGPSLFFSKSDLPVYKERIKKEPYKAYWDNLLKKANAYCDPNSKEYLDPENTIKDLSATGWYTRQLTARIEVLGFCYQMTGDVRYAQKVKSLLLSSIKIANFTNDVDKARCAVAHRPYAIGLDWCGDVFTKAERKQLADISKLYIENLFKEIANGAWWYPYHNYMGVDVGGIGLLALALDQDLPAESKQWAKKAADMETLWFSKGFDIGGAYFEGIGYSQFGLSDALLFCTAYKNKTGIDLLKHPMIKNIPDFMLMSLLPGENVFDARNDSNYQGMDEICMLGLVRYLKNPNFVWLWEKCQNSDGRDYEYPKTTGRAPWRIIWDYNITPQAPTPEKNKLAACYKERGLCIWRTGWDKDDLMFSIESGPYHSATHNQADKGHFTLYSHGYRWACDTAYANNRDPNGRGQTLAHNCILVDGKGQVLTGGALGTNGKIVSYVDNNKFGYALADNTEAYNHNIVNLNHENSSWFASFHLEKVLQPMKGIGVEHALRYSIFFKKNQVRPAYVVLFDDIKKDDSVHSFTWQQLTWPDINITHADNIITLKPKKNETLKPEYNAMLYAAGPLGITSDVYTAPDKRKPASYPRVKAITKARNPYFAAILTVSESGQKKPSVNYASSTDSTTITITWDGEIDKVTFYAENKKEPDIQIIAPH